MSRAGPHGWCCSCGEINVLTALNCVSCGDARIHNLTPVPAAAPDPVPVAKPPAAAPAHWFLLAFGGSFALLLILILAVASLSRQAGSSPNVDSAAPTAYVQPSAWAGPSTRNAARVPETPASLRELLPPVAPAPAGQAEERGPSIPLPVAPSTWLYVPERAETLPRVAVQWPQAPPGAPTAAQTEALTQHVASSTVLVFARSRSASETAAGIVVGPDRVLTCLHNVRRAEQVAVSALDGRQAWATVMRVDPVNDLALLHCAGGLPSALAVDAAAVLPEGGMVGVLGFPHQEAWPGGPEVPVLRNLEGVFHGRVTHRSPSNEDVEVLQVQAEIAAGFSGGPVYSLQNGTVLGLTSFRTTGGKTMAYAVPASLISRFLLD